MRLPGELERIRLPQKDKESLIRLKSRTGIGNWNTLCRWAFLVSLAEPKLPKPQEIVADSNVEMSWKTFAGEHDQLMLHLLVERCLGDGLPADAQTLSHQFRLHLHRGIAYLSTKGKVGDIADLVRMAE